MRSWISILFVLLIVIPAVANYSFLGKVISLDQRPTVEASILRITCEDGVELRLELLCDEMFRVVLTRSDSDEPLLEDALVPEQRTPVRVVWQENPGHYLMKTSALELEVCKSPCRIIVRDSEGRVINEDDPGMGMGWDGNEVRVWKTITPDEKFFGLGLKGRNVNKRGDEYVMWNTDFPAYEHRSDPLYQSIPFFVGLRGGRAYGIYFNNSYRSRFNMGAGNRRNYSFGAEGGALDYFFIYGPRIPEVVERYTELTGRPPLPPMWALGYQQCRWSYYPEGEVLRIASTFREKQIPCDAIYLDIHYMDGYRVFTWDPSRFPDPKRMTTMLGEQGFKVVTIIDPAVKADSGYRVAREGLAGSHFLRYPDGEVYVGEVWPGSSYFPDFSASSTRMWWGENLKTMLHAGVRGFWNDMNEPACWGQAFPLEVLHDDGGLKSSHKKMHNLYGLQMAQATYEGWLVARPNERPFILTRAGFAGEQRYTAVWTGDNVASEDHLELGIRMMLGMGLSGVPFVGTDVGGFIKSPTPELYARWIQVGALSPLFRTHTEYGSPDQEPWSFGDYTEEISRKFITLRYQLLPYFYSLFFEASRTGAPLLRPLFWSDQEDERTFYYEFQHQFFLGDYLLAAPVTRTDQYLKRVYLPRAQWLDWNTETGYSGDSTVIVDAPLDRLPLFLREGAIIPMRDLIQYVEEQPLRMLTIHVFAGESDGKFRLYEDDGNSFDYQNGRYRLTELTCRRSSRGIEFHQERIHDHYSPVARDLELMFHAVAEKPKRVTVDNVATESEYDAGRRLLTVRLPDTAAQRRVIIHH